MKAVALYASVFAFCLANVLAGTQERRQDGYIGYNLEQRGDDESAVYITEDTNTGPNDLSPIPDVYLNASVHVGEIDVEVDNLTAKVNLDAKVLNLLHFTAGVTASVDRVKLTIENVTAKVELEARLENVVQMVEDVLDAVDANPLIATLGQGIGDIVGNITDELGDDANTDGSSNTNSKRDLGGFKLEQNILYSVNDYSGMNHRNRILAQNGSIEDVSLDNQGNESGRKVVGYYLRDMDFTGHNRTVKVDDDGEAPQYELQYAYAPFPGLEVIANIFVDLQGRVISTQVIAEAEAGVEHRDGRLCLASIAILRAASTEQRNELVEDLKKIADAVLTSVQGILKYFFGFLREDDGKTVYVVEEYANMAAKAHFAASHESGPVRTLGAKVRGFAAADPDVKAPELFHLECFPTQRFTRPEIEHATGPYLVLGELYCVDGGLAPSGSYWKAVTDMGRDNEPGTLSYAILNDTGKAEHMFSIGAYESEVYLWKSHALSDAVKANVQATKHIRTYLGHHKLKNVGGFLYKAEQ